jgi:hypothetical protein
MSPTANLFLSYGARLQAMNAAACATPNCGGNFISHEISAGITFGLRPISLH